MKKEKPDYIDLNKPRKKKKSDYIKIDLPDKGVEQE